MTEGRFPMISVAFLPSDGGVGFALAGVLDTTQCDELIGVLTRRGFSPTGGAYPRDYRDNDRLVFDDAELAARWFERVGAQLPRELVVDGVALVGTADGAIHRLDGAEHARWTAHAAAITSLAVSPTGAWASSSEDGSVKRWRGDQLVRSLPTRDDFVTSVVFRRDGALIATGYDGVVWEDSDVQAA